LKNTPSIARIAVHSFHTLILQYYRHMSIEIFNLS
jgi:hypothetical protein